MDDGRVGVEADAAPQAVGVDRGDERPLGVELRLLLDQAGDNHQFAQRPGVVGSAQGPDPVLVLAAKSRDERVGDLALSRAAGEAISVRKEVPLEMAGRRVEVGDPAGGGELGAQPADLAEAGGDERLRRLVGREAFDEGDRDRADLAALELAENFDGREAGSQVVLAGLERRGSQTPPQPGTSEEGGADLPRAFEAAEDLAGALAGLDDENVAVAPAGPPPGRCRACQPQRAPPPAAARTHRTSPARSRRARKRRRGRAAAGGAAEGGAGESRSSRPLPPAVERFLQEQLGGERVPPFPAPCRRHPRLAQAVVGRAAGERLVDGLDRQAAEDAQAGREAPRPHGRRAGRPVTAQRLTDHDPRDPLALGDLRDGETGRWRRRCARGSRWAARRCPPDRRWLPRSCVRRSRFRELSWSGPQKRLC